VRQGFVLLVAVAFGLPYREVQGQAGPTEAPAGFDNLTNGFVDQATHDLDGDAFAKSFVAAEGLGPVYNARSCRDCHDNPVKGGNSQVPDLRAGHAGTGGFVEHPGGSLIHSRAIDARIQERVLDGNEVRTLRMSVSTLGGGFVEAIADSTLLAIAASQPGQSSGIVHGQAIMVPVPGGSASRVGRFGHKDQQASLLLMTTHELRDQISITSPLLPTENTSNGASVQAFDVVPDPEDSGDHAFGAARFIQASKVPPRDAELSDTPAARQGAVIFNAIGCAVCHVPTITTAPPGTRVGDYVVHPALGNKVIHPYSDFLLHDIGTGDGVAQNGGQGTRNTVHTAALWGIRARTRFMHDGLSLSLNEAILRHGVEGRLSLIYYQRLSPTSRNNLLAFLRSL
jgi:CxxC motif-containing protein (DUF1111 family)